MLPLKDLFVFIEIVHDIGHSNGGEKMIFP